MAPLRIAQGRGTPRGPHPVEALRLLDRLQQQAEPREHMSTVLEIQILRALALYPQGRQVVALAALARALLLAEPQGYVRIYADEGAPMAALLARLLVLSPWHGQEARLHHLSQARRAELHAGRSMLVRLCIPCYTFTVSGTWGLFAAYESRQHALEGDSELPSEGMAAPADQLASLRAERARAFAASASRFRGGVLVSNAASSRLEAAAISSTAA